MFNSIESYKNAGEKAGRASKNHDAGLVSHWKRWLSQALCLETETDRKVARRAYDQAYSSVATPSVSYFR